MSPSERSDEAFSAQDREKARKGTALSIIGGIVLAGVRSMGFFLRAIFGGEMWGLYAIAWALTELLAFLLLGGFNDAVVIFASRLHHGEDENLETLHYRSVATIIRAPLLASMAVATALHFYAPWLHQTLWSNHDPIIVSLVQTLAWSLPLLVLVQIPVEATRASLRFGFAIGIVQIAFPILSLLAALALYFTIEHSILAVAQGAIVALVFCLPASIYAYSRQFDLRQTLRSIVSAPWDREALSFALPQSLNMMLNQGLVRMDGLMLSFFGINANLIGIYALVGDLTQLIRLAKMAFSGVFSPLVAKYRAQNNRSGVLEALDHMIRKTSSLGVLLLLAVMSVWPLFIFSQGEKWHGSRVFPWLLAAGPMMSCFFGLCGNTLLMYGRSRLLLVNALVAGALNLVLNSLFIPLWGIEGAAIATAISNVTISVLQIVELRRFESISLRWGFYARTVAAGTPSILLVFWMTTQVLEVTGDSFGQSNLQLRVLLASVAILSYFALQWALPGARPFGPSRK